MDLKESQVLGADIKKHWYYIAKARAMKQLLGNLDPKTILDVGAGSAYFTEYLLEYSTAEEAWCVDICYTENSDALLAGKPVHYRRYVDSINPNIVLLMDVLEHVDDDLGLLIDYVNKVPYGTQFLISVPAFSFLWSSHDIFLEHKRRYTLRQIEDVVRKAGLEVKLGAYYFGFVFPIAAIVRLTRNILDKKFYTLRSQLTRHNRFVNFALQLISNVERIILTRNRLVGLTAFCLAEKIPNNIKRISK